MWNQRLGCTLASGENTCLGCIWEILGHACLQHYIWVAPLGWYHSPTNMDTHLSSLWSAIVCDWFITQCNETNQASLLYKQSHWTCKQASDLSIYPTHIMIVQPPGSNHSGNCYLTTYSLHYFFTTHLTGYVGLIQHSATDTAVVTASWSTNEGTARVLWQSYIDRSYHACSNCRVLQSRSGGIWMCTCVIFEVVKGQLLLWFPGQEKNDLIVKMVHSKWHKWKWTKFEILY